jgi:hypothetical protein
MNAGQNPFAERNTINHLTTQEQRHERRQARAIRLTRREAITSDSEHSSARRLRRPARGRRTALRRRTRPEQERLAISFWIWALWDTGPNRIVNDFEVRVAEAVERGFNCFRIEGGAGITHDAEGRPRGELEFYPVLPGHDLLPAGSST